MGTITVNGVGKAYKVYPTRFSRLKEWLVPFSKKSHSVKWVLSDINFSVQAGESIGIIGVNGAGKSTLLKMLTGTTQPTSGTINTTGRVAALLELGIGFHPEFTGRQNVYMAGQLLGMSVNEIRELMPEIEKFAEIGDYIDQPVRVYSSGMQVRLAFSVATAKRPDILIVDEALSVGDSYFQHKSFSRIREFQQQGTTLLIVAHDRGAVLAICNRALLLNDGGLALEGTPEEVFDYYNALIAKREKGAITSKKLGSGQTRIVSGTGEASVEEIRLLNANNERVESVEVGESVTLEVKVRVNADIPRLVLGFSIRDRLGLPIYGTNTHYLNEAIQNAREGDTFVFCFNFAANLGQGSYSISTSLVSTESRHVNNYESTELAYMFDVVNLCHSTFAGYAWLSARLTEVAKV